MTSIFYKIVHNFGESRKIAGSGSENVHIHVDGADGGIITVGNISAPLKENIARISLHTLTDGEYTPTLYKDGELFALETISKCGNRISFTNDGSDMIRRIALRAEMIEKRLDNLEKRCAEHEGAIYGKPIF